MRYSPLPVATVLAGVFAVLAPTTAASAQVIGGQWDRKGHFDGRAKNEALGLSDDGSGVAGTGDVDGDGTPDLIVGAAGAHPGGRFYAGSAYILSGATGEVLQRIDGLHEYDQFGSSVAGVGDLDGDGHGDVLVAAPYADAGPIDRAGVVYLISGATGALIRRFDGFAESDKFGASVAVAGDIDQDGAADLLIGAPLADSGTHTYSGAAYVYSGATGQLLLQLDGMASEDLNGTSVCGLGDIDGDGVDDLAVGAPGAEPGGRPYAGSVFVYSGATGLLVRRHDGHLPGDRMGKSVARAGDVDGDGVEDLITGAIATVNPSGGDLRGSALVYSGATGQLLHEFAPPYLHGLFGCSVSGAGDLDGDGFADLMVGAREAHPAGLHHAGSAYAFSGATGQLLGQIDGNAINMHLGGSVAAIGDLDGDGVQEVAACAPRASPLGRNAAGTAYVYAFARFLEIDARSISRTGGPPLQLALDFPASEAGSPFTVLGSLTGDGPSQFHGLAIPLTQDALFHRFLGHPSLTGTLDAAGRATRALVLHRRTPPAAVGRTLHLVAVSFDTSPLAGRMSSVVRYVEILP